MASQVRRKERQSRIAARHRVEQFGLPTSAVTAIAFARLKMAARSGSKPSIATTPLVVNGIGNRMDASQRCAAATLSETRLHR